MKWVPVPSIWSWQETAGSVNQKTFAHDASRFVFAVLLSASIGCAEPGPRLDDAADHFVAAQQALADGDTAKAMEELNASIEGRPNAWAYYQRAKLHSDAGDEAAAMADCETGLGLDPEHSNLQWLRGELKKPAGQRFKGKYANPPSLSK